jgi:hypothetical protein
MDFELKLQDAFDLHARRRYSLAAARYIGLLADAPPASISTRARLLQAVAHIEDHQWSAAACALDAAAVGQDRDTILSARRIITEHETGSRTSPTKAKIMSGFCPGLGQAYAGHWSHAVNAVVVSGLTGWYLERAVRTESYTEASLVALPLFLRYYIGNIQQAGRDATDANAKRDDRAVLSVLRCLGLTTGN